jgi:hypothetical protein
MHAVLKSLSSPDVGADSLETHTPHLPDRFGIYVEAEIGPDGAEGADLFGVTVCSPLWLAEAATRENPKGFEFVRHRLVVDRWDADLIRRAIGDLCVHATGDGWNEIATKLSRYLAWEFEDYKPA